MLSKNSLDVKRVFKYCIVFILLFISCNNIKNNENITYEPTNGDTIREFYDNNDIKKKYIYLKDSTKFKEYFEDGAIKIEGQFYNEFPVGVWNEFKESDGYPMVIREYLDYPLSDNLNQVIFFDDFGAIIYQYSRFFDIKNDTLYFFTPNDTISKDILIKKELRLLANNTKNNEVKLLLDHENRVSIEDLLFPFLVTEIYTVTSDSLIKGEKTVRILSSSTWINEENNLIKNKNRKK